MPKKVLWKVVRQFCLLSLVVYLTGCMEANSPSQSKEPPKLTAEQALSALTRKAEAGDAQAQYELGKRYNKGEGIPKDATKAAEWYQKAAEQGNLPAQLSIGEAFRRGEGINKDGVKAAEWYRKAAEQGDKGAQYVLGSMYSYGEGLAKDDALALKWYHRAASQGSIEAQHVLGLIYFAGLNGESGNSVISYMWFNLAAAQGHRDAANAREVVALDMSPQQIAEAQRLTREWKPGQHAESSYSYTGDSKIELAKTVTGTAFVVSEQGHLLTNRHVVAACDQVRLADSDKPLKLLLQDEANDLALLQTTFKPQSVAVFRKTNYLRQGETIAVYGYPLKGALAAGGNLAPGVVSALAGLGNNTSQIQITAPVQIGNSGGPVLDGKGQVVGVVVQKLDAVKVAKLTGDVPQNVNFAINESTARAFLDSNQVPYKTGAWWQFWGKSLEDTAAEARKYTVVVECWK